jgi:hypothetical protein
MFESMGTPIAPHPYEKLGVGADWRRRLRRLEHRLQDRLFERDRLRTATAAAMAICGGLAVVYLWFAVIGTINLGQAIAATGAATGLALVWLLGFWYRARTGPTRVQRHDRERRGF